MSISVKRTQVRQGYSRDERELHINYSDGDEFATVYTNISKYRTKLKDKGELLSCEYYISERVVDGVRTKTETEVAWTYRIEPSQLSFRNPKKKEEDMTPEELAKKKERAEMARERLLKARQKNNN